MSARGRGYPSADAAERVAMALKGPAGDVVRAIAGVPTIASRDRDRVSNVPPTMVAGR